MLQKRHQNLMLGGWGGRGWHKVSVLGCLPLAAPIGLSPVLILTLCGSKCVLVVSMEPLDDLSCLTTPGHGGSSSSILDANPPPTNCWPEAPQGSGRVDG